MRSGQAETLAGIEDKVAARLPDGGLHRLPDDGSSLAGGARTLALESAVPAAVGAEGSAIGATGAAIPDMPTMPGKLAAFQADADAAALGISPTDHDFRLSDEVLARWAQGDIPDYGGPTDVRAHLEDLVTRFPPDPGKEAARMGRIEEVVGKVNEKTPDYTVTPEAARLAVDYRATGSRPR